MMKKNIHNHKAFTMIELVFVIIVIGILAAMSLLRIERDIRQEAGDNILSAIRYAQHMALIDDKQSYKDKKWHQKLWMIRFETPGNEVIYKIGADNDKDGNIDKKDAAVDPLTGKYYFTTDATQDSDESPNIFLNKKYGINSVTFNNCKGSQATAAKHIAFDNYGRPFRGILDTTPNGGLEAGASKDFRTYVKGGQCEITFTSNAFDSNLIIVIKEETGYAYIKGQPDS